MTTARLNLIHPRPIYPRPIYKTPEPCRHPIFLAPICLLPIRLLPITPDIGKHLMKDYQFFTASMIPKGTYPGEDQDIETIGTIAVWIVGQQVPDKLVDSIAGALWTDSSAHMLEIAHPVGKEIKLDSALKGLVVPLHAGAAEYYRSVGKSVAVAP